MNNFLFYVILFFSFLETYASEQVDPDIVKQHFALKKFVESSDSTDETKSSDKSSNRSTESANTLGSFCFVVYYQDGSKQTLFPNNQTPTLYTSSLQTSPDENDSLPCLKEMEEHWKAHCPAQGKSVHDAANHVFARVKNVLDSLVTSRSDEVEQSLSLTALEDLIELQKKLCLAENNEEWNKAVRFDFRRMQQCSLPIFSVKSTDMNSLRKLKFTDIRDDVKINHKEIKQGISRIVRDGWHAEQRMVFKARQVVQSQQATKPPHHVVLCLYTDNAPCHSFKEDGTTEDDTRNECRCRQTLHNLSQKKTLGEAFYLPTSHPWQAALFHLTVSFSYKYEMDSISDSDKIAFAPWLFHLDATNILKSWETCPTSKKDAKLALKQGVLPANATGTPADGKSTKARNVKMPDQSTKLSVDSGEMNAMHIKFFGESKCGCSTPSDQWKHIQDCIKDCALTIPIQNIIAGSPSSAPAASSHPQNMDPQ